MNKLVAFIIIYIIIVVLSNTCFYIPSSWMVYLSVALGAYVIYELYNSNKIGGGGLLPDGGLWNRFMESPEQEMQRKAIIRKCNEDQNCIDTRLKAMYDSYKDD